MSLSEISKERAEAILEAYGANPDKWPEAERIACLEFVASHPELKSLAEGCANLDGLLAEPRGKTDAPVASNLLKARLLEDAVDTLARRRDLEQPPKIGSDWGPLAWVTNWLPSATGMSPASLSAVMGLVLILGMWLGASYSFDLVSEDDLIASFGEDYELWQDSDWDETMTIIGETG